MKTLLLLLICGIGSAVAWYHTTPEYAYSVAAREVEKVVYDGHTAVATSFTPKNPYHSMERMANGHWLFRGSAITGAAQGTMFVDRWEALWDKDRGILLKAKSIGSLDPAAPAMARADSPSRQASPGRAITWDPGLRRYIEHERTVSAMGSYGMNNGSGLPSTPVMSTAERNAREQWGWKADGTALDRPAH